MLKRRAQLDLLVLRLQGTLAEFNHKNLEEVAYHIEKSAPPTQLGIEPSDADDGSLKKNW